MRSSRKPLSAVKSNQPSAPPPSSKPPPKTAPKRAASPPATTTPDDAVEWAAIAGLVSAALLRPEDEASAVSRAHGRMLRLARQDDFDSFRQRLHREVRVTVRVRANPNPSPNPNPNPNPPR